MWPTLQPYVATLQLDEVQIAAEVEPLPWPGHEHAPGTLPRPNRSRNRSRNPTPSTQAEAGSRGDNQVTHTTRLVTK